MMLYSCLSIATAIQMCRYRYMCVALDRCGSANTQIRMYTEEKAQYTQYIV